LKALWKKHILQFKRSAGTSRGRLISKPSYLLYLQLENRLGVGECSILPGLSRDDKPDFESQLDRFCTLWEKEVSTEELKLEFRNEWPSLWFGVEMALLELENKAAGIFFPSFFASGRSGLLTNGLFWMGPEEYQWEQCQKMLENNFRCIKFKIGADYFQKSEKLLRKVRDHSPDITLRVDANGAFTFHEAKKVLESLKDLNVHSIEQPLAIGNWKETSNLVNENLIPIALDEELIFCEKGREEELLETANAQYLILKPSLLGGFERSDEWISLGKKNKMSFWITSALEGNIGLQAIAQYAAIQNIEIPQGLGTGSLFENNFPSDLEMQGEFLWKRIE